MKFNFLINNLLKYRKIERKIWKLFPIGLLLHSLKPSMLIMSILSFAFFIINIGHSLGMTSLPGISYCLSLDLLAIALVEAVIYLTGIHFLENYDMKHQEKLNKFESHFIEQLHNNLKEKEKLEIVYQIVQLQKDNHEKISQKSVDSFLHSFQEIKKEVLQNKQVYLNLLDLPCDELAKQKEELIQKYLAQLNEQKEYLKTQLKNQEVNLFTSKNNKTLTTNL